MTDTPDLLAALAASIERARKEWPITPSTAPATDIRCSICGDDSEPADCPDRNGWEDHCLTCMGSCLACQHRLDQGDL